MNEFVTARPVLTATMGSARSIAALDKATIGVMRPVS